MKKKEHYENCPTPTRLEVWIVRIIIGLSLGVSILALAESMI